MLIIDSCVIQHFDALKPAEGIAFLAAEVNSRTLRKVMTFGLAIGNFVNHGLQINQGGVGLLEKILTYLSPHGIFGRTASPPVADRIFWKISRQNSDKRKKGIGSHPEKFQI